MGRNGWIATVLVLGLLGGLGTLFAVQNSARTTQLSLDLGISAWQLEQPVSIPILIGVSFLSGFVLGGLAFWIRGFSQSRRVRRLEQEVAISSAVSGSGAGEPGTW